MNYQGKFGFGAWNFSSLPLVIGAKELSGPESLVNLPEVFWDENPVGASGQALLTGGTGSCFHRELAVLLDGPFFHPISFIIAFDAKEIGDGNLLRTGEALATISAKSFPRLPHPVHEVIDFLRG